MTQITAKIIEHSVSSTGKEITTFSLTYHRYVHAELMTHRVFSRNASSSRAVPIAKMLSQVWNNPATPVHWGQNQPGMQAFTELSGWKKTIAKFLWSATAKAVCVPVYLLSKIGLAKQIGNRLLEPWQLIHVVLTTTELDNWNALRRHHDAQPEIKVLADTMFEAKRLSKPVYRGGSSIPGWHLPYVTSTERTRYELSDLLKISAARCARVSYLLHDGNHPSVTKDKELFDRLVGSDPRHASPVEHQATPLDDRHLASGNFYGWKQYRKLLEAEWKAA